MKEKKNFDELIYYFEVQELEQRLENRWCTTTVTDNETGQSVSTTSKCGEA